MYCNTILCVIYIHNYHVAVERYGIYFLQLKLRELGYEKGINNMKIFLERWRTGIVLLVPSLKESLLIIFAPFP